MFSLCSELTPRARIPDTRIPQLMQPCHKVYNNDFYRFQMEIGDLKRSNYQLKTQIEAILQTKD